MLHAVIMCGGSGTRFWPASRRSLPKQLLAIGTDRPLVEETVDRLQHAISPENTLIVTNAAYQQMTAELLPEIPAENIIGEPVGRDTAACIGVAARVLMARDPEAVMAVMPSDHLIAPAEVFCASLEAAADLLKERPKALVTFGIKPTFPATGYGYIQQGETLKTDRKVGFHEVRSFREKPDQVTAEQFLEEGSYLWNAGIFLWRADTILAMIEAHLPQLHEGLLKIEPGAGSPEFEASMAEHFPNLEKISIDFGVMEKARERIVGAVSYAWDDVGSWRALERLLPVDEQGNRVQGPCRTLDAKDNIVSARGGMVGLINVQGLIVVHTPDATLVCRKDDAEGVKKLVDRLPEEYR